MKFFTTLVILCFYSTVSYTQDLDFEELIIEYYDSRKVNFDKVAFSYDIPKIINENILNHLSVLKSKLHYIDSLDLDSSWEREFYIYESDLDLIDNQIYNNKEWIWRFYKSINMVDINEYKEFIRKSSGNEIIILNKPIKLRDNKYLIIESRVIDEFFNTNLNWSIYEYLSGRLRLFLCFAKYDLE